MRPLGPACEAHPPNAVKPADMPSLRPDSQKRLLNVDEGEREEQEEQGEQEQQEQQEQEQEEGRRNMSRSRSRRRRGREAMERGAAERQYPASASPTRGIEQADPCL